MADPLQDNTSGISGLFNQMDEDGKPAIVVETTNRDGQPRVKFEMDQATANSITTSLKNYQKTIDAMNTRVNELQAREQKQRQNPLLSVLSGVAGNLAVSDRRLPPVVQALGRTNLQMNPTADQLARERIGLTEQIGKTELEAARTGLEVAREGRLEKTTQEEMTLRRKEGERRERMDTARITHEDNMTKLQEKKMELQLTLEKMKEGSKEKIEAQKEAQRINLEMSRERFQFQKQANQFAQQSSLQERRAALKGVKMDTQDKAALEGVSVGRDGVQNLSTIMEAHPAMMGLASGNKIVDAFQTRYGGEEFRQDFETSRKALTAAVNQAFGEKTRGFTKAGLEYNQSLIPVKTDSVEMARRKLNELNKAFTDRANAVAKFNKGVDLSAFGAESEESKELTYDPESGKVK